MATFDLGKDASDVQEPELLPQEWYPFVITEDPIQEPNRKMKDGGPTADGAGFNVVVKLVCADETPEYNGRPFRVWLPLPAPGDDEKYTPVGMKVSDSKIRNIDNFQFGFTGERLEGNAFALSAGMSAQLYVNQQLDQTGTTLRNGIDNFAGSKPIDME